MVWKLGEETAERLRTHALRRERRDARARQLARLAEISTSFSMLSDAAHDEIVAAFRRQPTGEERAWEFTATAIGVLNSIARPVLPPLCVFMGWDVDSDPPVLMNLADGLNILQSAPEFFSHEGCVILSPDGLNGLVFDFDQPRELSRGYIHLFGELWPPGALRGA